MPYLCTKVKLVVFDFDDTLGDTLELILRTNHETRRRMGAPVLNDEVVRVVKSAPKWKAAKYDGNPIRLTGNVRIVFTGE